MVHIKLTSSGRGREINTEWVYFHNFIDPINIKFYIKPFGYRIKVTYNFLINIFLLHRRTHSYNALFKKSPF